MKIAINGSNGFTGRYLNDFFKKNGYTICPIDRKFYHDNNSLKELLSDCDIVINLAGASISNRWTKEYKKVMWESRIETTKHLAQALKEMEAPPKHFISTSAVGIYENGKSHDENSVNYDDGFLGKLAQEWEKEALRAKKSDIKVSIFRFGVVLGDGGALSQMLPIFKLGLGGVLGDGSQGFSWIHIEDLANAYAFVIENSLDGVFNLTAPNPTTNEEFTKILGKIVKRPTFFKVPKFALELKFGEGATILLNGQKAIPKHLLNENFTFKYPMVEEALRDIL